jgi:putative ABC transport system permease protein
VLSSAVAQRTREIGIRMALGAQERTVLGLVVRQAMVLAGGGVAIGIVCALLLSRSIVATCSSARARTMRARSRRSG